MKIFNNILTFTTIFSKLCASRFHNYLPLISVYQGGFLFIFYCLLHQFTLYLGMYRFYNLLRFLLPTEISEVITYTEAIPFIVCNYLYDKADKYIYVNVLHIADF